MPYADPEKRKEAVKKAVEKNYISACNVRFKKDDAAFYEALQHGAKTDSITVTEYLRLAAREKLIRDGYLQENKDAE